jgi:hypothetical protein
MMKTLTAAPSDHPETSLADRLLPPDAIIVQPFVKVAATDPAACPISVIRESPKWNARLLQGMARQVLKRAVAAGYSGAQEVLDAVNDDFLPWRRDEAGEKWRREHHAVPLRETGSDRIYGYIFVAGGTTFVLAATSANTEDDEDLSNPFTKDLIALLERKPFTHLLTGSSSRLVRRKRFGEELGAVFARKKMIVTTSEAGTIDFTGGHGFAGQMASANWTQLCQFSETEVKGILLRTTLGRINAMLNGCWTEGEKALPPHCMTGERNKLVLSDDPAQLELAREIVRIAAEAFDRQADGEPMTDEEVVKRLTAHGAKKAGTDQPLTDHTDFYSAVWRRFQWIPRTRAGVYRRRQELPMSGLQPDDVLGLEVAEHRNEAGERIESVLFEWTLPELDGIDEETWEKAETFFNSMRNPRSKRRRQPVGPRRPLHRAFTGKLRSGEHVMLRANGASYEVRRVTETGNLLKGKSPVASVPSSALHTRLVDAIVAALANDQIALADVVLRATTPAAAPAAAVSPERCALMERRDALTEQIEEAEAWLNSVYTHETAKPPVQAEVDVNRRALHAVEEQLDELGRVVVSQDGGEVPTAKVRHLADLLAVLETAAAVPPAIHRMVLELLHDSTVQAETWQSWVEFTTHLRLRLTDGREVITAPITFTTRNEARGQRTVGDKIHRDRFSRVLHPELVRLRCQGDDEHEVTFGWLAERVETNPRAVRSTLVDVLVGAAVPGKPAVYRPVIGDRPLAAAWLDSPALVRGVLYDLAANDPGLPWIGTGWDDRSSEQARLLPETLPGLKVSETKVFLRVIRERYLTTGETWNVSCWSRGGERDRRELAAAVRNGSVVTTGDAAEMMGWAQTSTVQNHLHGYHHGRGAVLELCPDDPKGTPFEHRRVRLRTCGSCGADDLHFISVPEVEGEVACRECHVVLAAPDVKLPDIYFEWWEGPYGSRSSSRTSQTDALGTRLGAAPLAATPHRQASKRRLAGQDWHNTTPTATCDAVGCTQTVARVTTRYCVAHQERSARNQARLATRRAASICAFDGCKNHPREVAGGGRGRPPKYCDGHGDAYQRRLLLRAISA